MSVIDTDTAKWLTYFDGEASVAAGKAHHSQSHYSVRVTVGPTSDLKRNLTADEAAQVIRVGVFLAEDFGQELVIECGQERN